jgi:dipeptidyl aminopeptidase/acylaminoacyl peptidase
MRRCLVALTLSLAFPAAFTLPAIAQRLVPLAIDDALTMRSFPVNAPTRVVAISPDGRLVASVTQDSRRSRGARVDESSAFTATGAPTTVSGCDIHLTDTRTNATKNLTQGKGSNWGPVWSPDGKRLAFYSDRGGRQTVWVWERASGALRQVAAVIARPRHGWELTRWSYDSRLLLVKVLPAGMTLPTLMKKEEKASGITVYRSDDAASPSGLQLDPAARADLALLAVNGGRVRRVARDVHPVWYDFAPDGGRVAFATISIADGKAGQDLLLVSLTDLQRRVLAAKLQLGFPAVAVAWSPDGQSLSYVSPTANGKPGVFVVSTKDGQARSLSAQNSLNFAHGMRAPVWDAGGGALYAIAAGDAEGGDSVWKLPANGDAAIKLFHLPQRLLTGMIVSNRALLLRTFHQATKRTGFARVALDTGQHTLFGESDTAYATHGLLAWATLFVSLSAGAEQIAFTAESAAASPDVWLAEVSSGATRQLTRLNPQLAEYVFGESRQIEYASDDGEPLRGALLLPTGYKAGHRYPLVVWVIESTRGSHNLNRFGLVGYGVDNLQLLATRGYAVLFPDSLGRAGEAARNLAGSIPAAVQKVVELGIANPDRVGVMGFSYGAYSTALLITRTELFKAAVVRGGYYNAVSQYGQMGRDGVAAWTGILEAGHNIRGNPWTARARFIENSPVFHLDRVRTPVLIVSGSADTAARPSQAEELFVGLRRLGKRAEYVRYEGEEHVQTRWSYRNQHDYCRRMLAWFERYLKP